MKKMKQFLMVLILVFSVSVVFSQDDNNDCYIKQCLLQGNYQILNQEILM